MLNQLEQLSLMALPAPDHLATFRGPSFPKQTFRRASRPAFVHARSPSRARGNRGEALATYRSLRDTLAREGALKSGGPLPERTVAAVQRLSK